MSFMHKDDYEKYVREHKGKKISEKEIKDMKAKLSPLIGVQFNVLSIPKEILKAFEPSQVGTIVGTLMDACIPQLSILTDSDIFNSVGLSKNKGILGEREGYPDYIHTSGKRLELKLLFVNNPDIKMKKPPTPREPSARLTQKVSLKNVLPDKDMLLVIAYALKERKDNPNLFSPTIIDLNIFSVYECILARDRRMYDCHGGWFGLFETPAILSKQGKKKMVEGLEIDYSSYGRKENEGRDLNEDTNFGKLKRIPYPPLECYLLRMKKSFNNDKSKGTIPRRRKGQKDHV